MGPVGDLWYKFVRSDVQHVLTVLLSIPGTVNEGSIKMDQTPSSEKNQIVQKITVNWSGKKILAKPLLPLFPRTRDVSTGAVDPKLKIVIIKNPNC